MARSNCIFEAIVIGATVLAPENSLKDGTAFSGPRRRAGCLPLPHSAPQPPEKPFVKLGERAKAKPSFYRQ
ncbi:hypothetical protein [Bradyrhizobium yuanmingense]|uniref:Uncharacterized protein n=1 Tax=Bradyrhizobium yuanmingense TaxID=108015 RepID=A0ABV4GFI6_9BRAD|nr:hypothetical protein [Bradyrhizobium yuanmingense]